MTHRPRIRARTERFAHTPHTLWLTLMAATLLGTGCSQQLPWPAARLERAHRQDPVHPSPTAGRRSHQPAEFPTPLRVSGTSICPTPTGTKTPTLWQQRAVCRLHALTGRGTMPWKNHIPADFHPGPLEEGSLPYAGLSLPLKAGDPGYECVVGVEVYPLNQAQ